MLQVISLAIIVGAAVVYVLLERLFPYTPGQRILRDGFWNDFLMYTLLQSYVLGLAIDAIIRALHGRFAIAFVTGWPLWARVGFFFVTHDFYIYCFHRLQHANRYLWRTHEAHHSVRDVDWLAGSRSHPIEILINQTIEFAPISLLGAGPEVAIIKGTMDAVWGMWIHANVDVRSGWLQYVINGPEMHRWHHKDDISDGIHNFSTKLAIWDWIFGTAYRPKDSKPPGFGILDYDYPETFGVRGFVPTTIAMVKDYVVQTLFAFRPFPKSWKAYGLTKESADEKRERRRREIAALESHEVATVASRPAELRQRARDHLTGTPEERHAFEAR